MMQASVPASGWQLRPAMTLPRATIGPELVVARRVCSWTRVCHATVPLFASSASTWLSDVTSRMLVPKIASVRLPSLDLRRSGGSVRRYSHRRSPVAASNAWMTSLGFGRYMTPS
jgi:hypothetical protein